MRAGIAAVVMGLVLGVSGCGGGGVPTLPSSPSGTPVFASEEEALAAAEAAYAAYLAMSNLIASEGGADPERIAEVALRELLESSIEGFATLRENKWRAVGESRLTGVSLQFADLGTEIGESVLGVYLCVDVSDVDVLDANGGSVVSPMRPDLQAFEVHFDLVEGGRLLPSEREPWDGVVACVTG